MSMDRQAQRKALFRSKLREASQNRGKRIDSPLVRYNESDQPVCRVCNVILKSESLWPAHQASLKHHEAIENFKATAAGATQSSKVDTEKLSELHQPHPSSTLLADNRDTKRQKAGLEVSESAMKIGRPANDHLNEMDRSENRPANKFKQPSKKTDYSETGQMEGTLHGSSDDNKKIESQISNKFSQAPKKLDNLEVRQVKKALPDDFFDNKETSESLNLKQLREPSKKMDGLESKQVKGALPEGFFDNKDADMRARGIEPVKVDINDAFKEFEKEIQGDLQGVDDRLEEEEIDAAEIREEYESLEQQAYREKVEMVKKQLMDVKAARIARGKKSPAFKGMESSDESSSDDDDSFAVDWRAKHL